MSTRVASFLIFIMLPLACLILAVSVGGMVIGSGDAMGLIFAMGIILGLMVLGAILIGIYNRKRKE